MKRYLRLSTRASAAAVAGVALFVMAGRLLPPGWQAWARAAVGAAVGVVLVLGALCEFTGYSVRDIVARMRGARAEITDDQRAMRNRRAMLALVKSLWVKGVLEQSLHGAALMQLGMEERADAVRRPCGAVVRCPGKPDRGLGCRSGIVEVFEERNRALLILGEPGSGKTTVLLELARDTIARAEKDPTEPIPVVLNLSSWSYTDGSVSEWLVEELNEKYSIPRRIARAWVERDDLLLLLDGLDEVRGELREGCVKELNRFRKEHLVPLAVCSRSAEYEVLTAQLGLQGAVELKPLSPQQIDQYLSGAGTELLAVRRTLERDPTLGELAKSPLFLSVMALAYRGWHISDLRSFESIEARRRHLFGAYVERMFERRKGDERYSRKDSARWLAWLAGKMSEHSETVFLVERMQPSWLATDGDRQRYRLSWAVPAGTFAAVVCGLAGWVFQRLAPLMSGVVLLGSGIGRFTWRTSKRADYIQPVEALNWSWEGARKGVADDSVAWPLAAAFAGVVMGLFGGLWSALTASATVALLYGLAAVLPSVVYGGLGHAEIRTRIVPNQGVRLSARNSLAVLVILGPVFVLACGLAGALAAGPLPFREPSRAWSYGLDWALMLGVPASLSASLVFGGFSCIQHFTLRYWLWRQGYIPWNYVRFLDFAAERILLRKVGGGYIFIHRLLQDHFAGLERGGTSETT